MPELAAVFLDVDETLVDLTAAALVALRDVVGPDADWDLWCAMTETHYPRFVSGELDFHAALTARMSGYLAEAGLDVERAADYELRRNAALERSCTAFDDVAPLLADLRRRDVTVGIITNSEPDHQRAKLSAAGLAGAFDVEIISGEVGVGKPDPAVFALACERAAVDPAAAVHVGDRLTDDARAATAAGLTGVWLARPGLADPADAEEAGVPVITTLSGLPALLDARFDAPGEARLVARDGLG